MKSYNHINYSEGQKLGNAIFVREYDCGDKKNRKAIFKCVYCDNEFTAYINNIKKLHTKSCGCQASRNNIGTRSITHGCTSENRNTTEYNTWASIKSRCYNKKNKSYKNYGGRGIIMYYKWFNSFDTFLKDMGPKPSEEYTIERINNDRNYEPSNCKWATRLEQGRNKRNVIKVDFAGTQHLLKPLCKQLGISYRAIYQKHHRGGLPYQEIFNSYNFKHNLT